MGLGPHMAQMISRYNEIEQWLCCSPQARLYKATAAQYLITGCFQDAYNLADKLVTTYGVSDIGIVSYAPSSLEPGANRVAYGVGLYDADDELFGRNTPALLMHPSDELHNRFKRATLRLVLQAYRDALELVHSQREAHAALVSMLLEQKVVMGSELASLVEQYPAVGEVPSMPDDVVRQLVRVVGGWGGAKTPMPTQEAAFEVAKH